MHHFLRAFADVAAGDEHVEEAVHRAFQLLAVQEQVFGVVAEAFLVFFCVIVLLY